MKTFKKLLFLLSSHERNQAVLLLIMIIFMAFLDMIGIASILPFVAVLTNLLKDFNCQYDPVRTF